MWKKQGCKKRKEEEQAGDGGVIEVVVYQYDDDDVRADGAWAQKQGQWKEETKSLNDDNLAFLSSSIKPKYHNKVV